MYNLTNQTIIDAKVGSITEKHNYNKVILVGTYLYKDSSYVENVDIAINEKDGHTITTKIPYSGYDLELF